MNKFLLDDNKIIDAIKRALADDLGDLGDITANYTVSDDLQSNANCVAKEDMVVCGVDIAQMTYAIVDDSVEFEALVKDGDKLKSGDTIFKVKGCANSIVQAERVAINFLGHLSGIASQAYELQEMVSPYGVTLLDTRKTTPTLRYFEKYAVSCGGAQNHRIGLFDMFLIKENHLYSAGIKTKDELDLSKLTVLVKKMKDETKLKVEIETENMREFKTVLNSGCDIIMLDNFSPTQISEAINWRNEHNKNVKLEASGGINPVSLLQYAQTGVDFISMGALTHSVRSRDVSLRVVD